MGRREDNAPDQTTTDRLNWLEENLSRLTDLSEQAEGSKSWQAVSAFERQRLQIRNEVDQVRVAMAAANQTREESLEDLTPEEWASRIVAWAEDAPADDIERVVQVWLRREGREIKRQGAALMLVQRTA
jgi:hypothetical protein